MLQNRRSPTQLTVPSYSPQTVTVSTPSSTVSTPPSMPGRHTGPVFLAQRSTGGLNEMPKYTVQPLRPQVNLPKLILTEEPEEKFRFRYKSEMSGTHGCIHGKNWDKKTKIYPTTKVENVEEGDHIRIRVGLYTQPNKHSHHVHKLMMKGVSERDDEQDFIELDVPKDKGRQIVWKGLGIIHTSKVHIMPTIIKRKKQIALEEKQVQTGKQEKLSTVEEVAIEESAKKAKEGMNKFMNTVYLGWEAFKVKEGLLYPLSDMVFSAPIRNLKNPSTGDLKITRISKGCGSVSGGDEIFIFTERVIKGDIKIRFFQLEKEDEPDDRAWEDWATFNENDVHHQYAIAFKTPAYKDQTVCENVDVYFELYRPSDQTTSEKKTFRYTPALMHTQAKRRRYCSEFSAERQYPSLPKFSRFAEPEARVEMEVSPPSLASTSLQHNQYEYGVPTSVVQMHHSPPLQPSPQHAQPSPQMHHSPPPPLHPTEQNIQVIGDLSLGMNDLMGLCKPNQTISESNTYGSISKDGRFTDLSFSHAIPVGGNIAVDSAAVVKHNKPDDNGLVPKTLDDIVGMISSFESMYRKNPENRQIRDKIVHFLGYTTPDGDNLIHTGVLNGDVEVLKYLLRAVITFNCQEFLDERNKEGDTPLHLSIKNPNTTMTKLLLESGSNPNVKNLEGNSAVHLALIGSNSNILALLLNNKWSINPHLNIANNDGLYPFHLAVKTGKLEIVIIMKEQGCDFNIRDRMRGSTPLHLSLELGHVHITRYLVLKAMVNPTVENFAGQSGLAVAQELGLSHLLEPAQPHHKICTPENDKILTEWVTETLSNEDIRLDDFREDDLKILEQQLRPYERWRQLAEELGLQSIVNDLEKSVDPPVALLRYLKGIDWKVKVLAEALAKILVKDEEPTE